MSSLAILGNTIPATTQEAIDRVIAVENRIREHEQAKIKTEHIFHAGMYIRTVRLEKYTVFTSVLIKVPTLVIVNGNCDLFAGDQWVRLEGYNVVPANAGRKGIYVTRSAVDITMIFPSNAKTVEAAEAQFTNEANRLLSRTQSDDTVIFTEALCLE
jgi:hypothetical protein